MSEINKLTATVEFVIDSNNFTINIDTTSFTPYSSGGTVGKAETAIDDNNGNMVTNLGGIGSVNYATGVVNVSFVNPPANSTTIECNYYEEDATSGGIADFTYTSPTRVTGEGSYFRQDDSGPLQSSLPYNGVYYDLHSLKSWLVNLTPPNDNNATNTIWRDGLGIPYALAAYADGDGITLMDYTDEQNPRLRTFGLNSLGTLDFTELSDQLNLSPYEFDYAIVDQFSNYDLLFCQAKTLGKADPYNSLLFIRNKVSGCWDKLAVPASCLAVYNGMLIVGDFTSPNCYQLFSGYDDDNFPIDNYITFSQLNLGVPGLKKTHRFEIDGYIGPSQSFKILIAYDNASPVVVGTIKGSDACVDVNAGTVIGGNNVIGSDIVGGSGAPNAFHFARDFVISSDRYEQMQIQFKALAVGPLAINYFGPKDNRYKGRRKLPQYDS